MLYVMVDLLEVPSRYLQISNDSGSSVQFGIDVKILSVFRSWSTGNSKLSFPYILSLAMQTQRF